MTEPQPGRKEARKLAGAERRRQALTLRIDGQRYEAIGLELGVSRQAAHAMVRAALIEVGKEEANELRALEVARLDRLLETWWPYAMGENSEGKPLADGPDIEAAGVVLKVIAQRCKILGIDAPIKVEVELPWRVVLELDGEIVTDVTPPTDGTVQ